MAPFEPQKAPNLVVAVEPPAKSLTFRGFSGKLLDLPTSQSLKIAVKPLQMHQRAPWTCSARSRGARCLGWPLGAPEIPAYSTGVKRWLPYLKAPAGVSWQRLCSHERFFVFCACPSQTHGFFGAFASRVPGLQTLLGKSQVLRFLAPPLEKGSWAVYTFAPLRPAGPAPAPPAGARLSAGKKLPWLRAVEDVRLGWGESRGCSGWASPGLHIYRETS